MTKSKGLYPKFQVTRTDGDPTGKHANCRYFVLDPEHDPAARLAVITYAGAIRPTNPELASDLMTAFKKGL